jgi:hypothetical protein
MIRSLLRPGLLLALSVVLLNCSKKEETPDAATRVQGTWKLAGLNATPAIRVRTGSFTGSFSDLFPLVKVAYPCISDVTLTMAANTTQLNTPQGCTFTDFEAQQQLGVSFNGTYSITGNKLELISSNSKVSTFDLTTSGNQMTWAYDNRFVDPDAPTDATKAINSRVTITFEKVP